MKSEFNREKGVSMESIKKISKRILIISIPFFTVFILNGCVAASSYYSARTLETNKFAVGLGADDIVLKDSKTSSASIGISKDLPFAPSVGLAYGLPLRLETGLRWYPPRFLEFSLREQINPRTFDPFDCSLDLSYAGLVDAYSYLKYGATISKNINGFEPYIHYYFYSMTGKMTSFAEGDLDGFITDISKEIINNSRTAGFGIGIPFKSVEFFPTVDYQYYNNDLSIGLWQFGIGLRIYTN
jgi:hypothetical protein